MDASDSTQKVSMSGADPDRGNTVAAYKFGILNWYEHPVSSGRLEGTNNKIEYSSEGHMATEIVSFLKLRILSIHEERTVYRMNQKSTDET